MTIKNRKKPSATPISRKRLPAPAPTPATAAPATAETVPQVVSFQAALAEVAQGHVEKRVPRKRAPARRKIAPAVQPVPSEAAAPPEPQSSMLLVRVWLWLQLKYVSLAKKRSAAAEPLQLVEKPPVALTDGANKQAKPRRRASSLSRTETIPSPSLAPNAMTRAFSWLQTKYTLTATKRLRVAETVSLGEKRFVALVSVDGREFLIGGGASGLSMLADLGSGSAAANAPQLGGVAQ